MDYLLIGIMISCIGLTFLLAGEGFFKSSVVCSIIVIIILFLLIVIFRFDPKITEKTMTTDTYLNYYKFSKPVKIIEKEYDYPYSMARDRIEIFIEVNCE